MIDPGIIFIIVWIGCFLVVSVDSAMRGTSSVFWRLASLAGGPFALVAYGIVRELAESSRRDKQG